VERGAALPGEVYPQIACRPIVMQMSLADPTPLGEVDEWKEVLAVPREQMLGDVAAAIDWAKTRPGARKDRVGVTGWCWGGSTVYQVAATNHDVKGAVLASDAFFPFPDGPRIALDAGAAAIVQPGGSRRDQDVIDAVEKAGAAMVFTGRRHFRH